MIVGDPKQRAEFAIVFAHGLEEAGLVEIARRLRLVAGDVGELVDELQAERSARRRMQGDVECLRGIVGQAAYQACVKAAGS